MRPNTLTLSQLRVLTCIACGTLLLISCEAKDYTPYDLNAVDEIHDLMRQGDFSAIAVRADPEYRKALVSSQDGFAALVARCGKPGKSSLVDRRPMEYGLHGELETVVLTMDTEYERGILREQFFFRDGSKSRGLTAFRYNGNCESR